MKCSYMYVYTRMIFAAVLSPTIKIFHRHLGPNLYIFAVKVSPWFHRHFTEILWHITAISPRKNTDQGDFVLKSAVHTVGAKWPGADLTWYSIHCRHCITVEYGHTKSKEKHNGHGSADNVLSKFMYIVIVTVENILSREKYNVSSEIRTWDLSHCKPLIYQLG